MAEAVTNHLAGGQIIAASAGSHPAPEVHPLSLKYLQERHIPTRGLHSKSWDKIQEFQPHAIVTLCDSAAAESCPPAFGSSIRQHWPLQDPSATFDEAATSAEIKDDSAASRVAFFRTIDILEQRVSRLLKHETESVSNAELARQLDSLANLF